MSNSNYTVNTYSYILDSSAEECLKELAGLGFTDFELMMYPGHAWPNDMDDKKRGDLKKTIRDLGVNVNSLNQPNVDINLAAATPEMRAYSLGIVKSIVKLAGELEVPWVVIGPGKVNPLMPAPFERVLSHFHNSLDELIELSNRVGTKILVENMPFAFLPDAKSLMKSIEKYSNEDVGVVYDIANGAFINEDILGGLQTTQPKLELVHVSDTTRNIYKHDPIGDGDIDFESVRESLKSIGWYNKPVLEIIGQSNDPKQEILKSVRNLKEVGWG